MKKVWVCLAILFFSLVTGQSLADTTSPQPEHLNQVVAIVNSEIISNQELDKQEALIRFNLANGKATLPPETEFRMQVLQNLINQALEVQMAEKVGVSAESLNVSDAIERIAKNNKMTVDELKKKLAASGVDFNYYQQQIKQQMLVGQLAQQEVGGRIRITDQNVENILNSEAYAAQNQGQYHLQDILIALPDVPSSEEVQAALNKANTIMEQLKKGKDFQQIAIGQSNGQEALKGGDLDWRSLQELPQIFSEPVQSMKVGDYYGPIRTANGFHIIKLLEKKGGETQHFSTQTNVRHILLIKNALFSDEQIKAKLEKMRTEIQQGEDFAKLAEKNSQDPLSASKGGSLGWVKPGFLTPPFEKAMNALKPGEISAPVESQYGWHLIQVQDRKQVDDTAEYRNQQVRRMLFQRQYDEKFQNWIEEMREASYIKIFDKNL